MLRRPFIYPTNLLRQIVHHKKVTIASYIVLIVLMVSGAFGGYVYQNQQASSALNTAKKLDNTGQYLKAQQELNSVHTFLVRASLTRQLADELARSKRLADVQTKIKEVQKLLEMHQTQAALNILKSVSAADSGTQANKITTLQNMAQQQATGNGKASNQSGANSGAGSSGGGSSNSGNGGTGGSPAPSPTPPPPPPAPPGPLTAITVNSFSASSSPATASTCNISDALSFNVNGSGTVSTTWKLISTKTTSEITNPTNFTFSAAGNQSDSFYFNGMQGLESGDSYRISVIISDTNNASITTTAGPVTISSCAAPPALAAETEPVNMTSITPGTPVIYQSQDGIFTNECSVNIQTPYSVNGSGTVEAIVKITSGSSGGYTYYDENGVTSFTGAGNATDSAYLRLPHLNAGDQFTVTVKLVEVSAPSTVFATTTPTTMACS